MPADNMTKSHTPIGGALKDYYQTIRDGYKASKDAQKSRSDSLKDARAAGKTVWAADKAVMKTSGWLRKKTAQAGRQGGSTPLNVPPAPNAPASTAPSGGFRVY